MRPHAVLLVGALLLVGCTADEPAQSEGGMEEDPMGNMSRENASSNDAIAVPSPEDDPPVQGPTEAAPTPEPAPAPQAPTPSTEPTPEPVPEPATPSPVATPPPAAPPASPAPAAPTPTPSPTPSPPAEETPWPREGSYVQYTARVTQSFSGSPQGWRTFANLSWVYEDGDWHGECVAQVYSVDHDGVASEREERVTYHAGNPPHWPLFNTRSPPAVGETMTTWTARGCVLDDDQWPYRGTDAATFQGEPVAVHRASSNPDEPPYDFSTSWHTGTGLVLDWSLQRYMTQAPFSSRGELVATDAPLG